MRNPFNSLIPYFSLLEEANECLAGVKYFNFYPGMLFRSLDKWWPDSGLRSTNHEGLDICYYTDSLGKEQKFTPQISIPAMASGRIFASCHDFLGQSLFIDHGVFGSLRFLSVYAHIVQHRHIMVGQKVKVADVVGVIADTTGRKNRMPAHVHLSLMRIPESVSFDMLDWNYICNSDEVELVDPVLMFRCERVRIQTKNPWKEKVQLEL